MRKINPRSGRAGRSARTLAALLACTAVGLGAQEPGTPAPAPDASLTAPYSADECAACAGWNEPLAPFRIHGTTYHVGTRGLGAILITSDAGHVLIDGGLPESAPRIMANIRSLGFRVDDIRLILNSHAHFDHAGGIAALQRASGAEVAASPTSATVLERGVAGDDDPQHGVALDFPPATDVRRIRHGETLTVGPLALTAVFTPGHTPGGTSWTWRSCEGGGCLDLVYADSQTPVSADGFLFTDNTGYPTIIADFERSHARLEALRCDVLLTPHPQASRLPDRLAARDAGQADALVDPDACRRYAATARQQLERRLETERSAH